MKLKDLTRVGLVLVGLTTVACRPETPLPADVLATFDGGSIRTADVDRAVLDLPANVRPQRGANDLESWQLIVRRMALNEILLAQGLDQKLDEDTAFLALVEDLRRDHLVRAVLANHVPPPSPISEDDLRTYFATHTDIAKLPGRRMVYHLFKRFRPGIARAEVMAEVSALRRRVLQGEPFPEIAANHSDSELRHRSGLMGIVEKGTLDPSLERLVFALAEGETSEPQVTSDGVHLFFVKEVVAGKQLSFEESRLRALQNLQAERETKRITEWFALQEIAEPPPNLDPAVVNALYDAGDLEAVFFEVGDYQLNRFRLDRAIANVVTATNLPQDPAEIAERLWRREMIYRRALELKLVDAEAFALEMDSVRKTQLVGFVVNREIEALLDAEPERLERFYAANVLRFSSMLRLKLTGLMVPLGDDRSDLMARLEDSVADLDSGAKTLEGLTTDFDGTTLELGWLTLGEVERFRPAAITLLARLDAGQHTSPYRKGEALEILRVDDRQEPQPRPFSEVRDQVRTTLILNQETQLSNEVADRLLSKAHFTLDEERLRAFLDSGLGAIVQPTE